MSRVLVYLNEGELRALREVAKRSGKSLSCVVREAAQKVWLRPKLRGPFGLQERRWPHPAPDLDKVHDEIWFG